MILLVTHILAAIPYTSSFVDDEKIRFNKAYLPRTTVMWQGTRERQADRHGRRFSRGHLANHRNAENLLAAFGTK